MIYLAHQDGAIAACEMEETAARCEARGFVRCSASLHRAYWQRKDRNALAAMAWAVRPIERAVGEKRWHMERNKIEEIIRHGALI